MCGNVECKYHESVERVKGSENFIFTPDSEITQQKLIHAMMSGVRIFNVNLTHGTEKDHQELVNNLDSAVKIYSDESKFNIKITKVCEIRGKVPRTGRMRNDCRFRLYPCDEIILTCDKRYQNCSTNDVCYVSNFKRLIPLLRPGDDIKIGSEISLNVRKIALSSYVTCYVAANNCELQSYKKVKIPAIIDESFDLTEEELEDLEFAKRHQFDMIIVPSVNRPERYHKLKQMIKGRCMKIIAGISTKVDDEKIDRVIEHFYGIFIERSSTKDRVIAKAQELQKLILVGFPTELFLGHRAMKLFEAADSFLLNSSESLTALQEASIKWKKFMENSKPRQKNNVDEPNKVKPVEFENVCINSALEVTKASSAKAFVCITQKEITAKNIASSRPSCPVILITKCPTIAKRIQLWRDVNAMVYVDCDKKSWKDQREVMMKIAAMFGKEMGFFEADNLIVTCSSKSESDGINGFEINKICK